MFRRRHLYVRGTVRSPVVTPITDHVSWLLEQEDIPLAEW